MNDIHRRLWVWMATAVCVLGLERLRQPRQCTLSRRGTWTAKYKTLSNCWDKCHCPQVP